MICHYFWNDCKIQVWTSTGTSGNERTDSKTKETCLQPPFANCIVSEGLICFVKKVVYDEWLSEWNTTIDNKLCLIKSTVSLWAVHPEVAIDRMILFAICE